VYTVRGSNDLTPHYVQPEDAKGRQVWLAVGYHAPVTVYQCGPGQHVPRCSPECIRFCLNKAGRGGIFKKGEKTNAVQEARKWRTARFVSDPDFFWDLDNEINRHANKASKLGLNACVRLNGTSDIDWIKATAFAGSLFGKWSGVQFYDYTKSFSRMMEFLTAKDYPEVTITSPSPALN
jgi:hypothetical protein